MEMKINTALTIAERAWMSESAIESNLEYFRSIRKIHVEKAVDAWAEERAWELALASKKDPGHALEMMLQDK